MIRGQVGLTVNGTKLRSLRVAAAGVTAAMCGLASAGAASATAAQPAAAPGAQLWARTYGQSDAAASPRAMALNPGGTVVFVSGEVGGRGAVTVAYRAATGTQLWVAAPGGEQDVSSIAVSPDGRIVFVAGDTDRYGKHGRDFATQAFSAATGGLLWLARLSSGGVHPDFARSLAVSPDGKRVYVTGDAWNNYATVAYEAATGQQLWAARYDHGAADYARSIAASPDGSTVFVTGESWGGAATKKDYATVAYSAGTGRQLWVSRFTSAGAHGDYARSITAGPRGDSVFVTGDASNDYATIAYSAATGRQLWVKDYNGPGNGLDTARMIVTGPGSSQVYVTGSSRGDGTGPDYATVAYSAATGKQLWVARYNRAGHGFDSGSAVSAARAKVYVTGSSMGATSSLDYATVAYNASTGARLWAQFYNGPGNDYDIPAAITASPGGGHRVFVTGYSTNQQLGSDYATIAYAG